MAASADSADSISLDIQKQYGCSPYNIENIGLNLHISKYKELTAIESVDKWDTGLGKLVRASKYVSNIPLALLLYGQSLRERIDKIETELSMYKILLRFEKVVDKSRDQPIMPNLSTPLAALPTLKALPKLPHIPVNKEEEGNKKPSYIPDKIPRNSMGKIDLPNLKEYDCHHHMYISDIHKFITQYCIITGDKKTRIKTADIFNKFKEWAKEEEECECPNDCKSFGGALSKLSVYDNIAYWAKTGRTGILIGIDLVD